VVFAQEKICSQVMSKTNIQYLIAIAILLGINLFLFLDDRTVSASSFDDSIFSIADTSAIQSIQIKNSSGVIDIRRSTKGWIVNDKYRVDNGFKNILFSIMQRVKVKRKVGSLNTSGSGEVTFRLDHGSFDFRFLSDPLGTKSFFVLGDAGYQVEVPGYRDNVINIFDLSSDQWRDRLVFDGSWRTIQVLELSSPESRLRISFRDQFFEIEGVPAIDSSMVVDYLNQFQHFQANEIISKGRFPQLDSLKRTLPMATLTIEDIKRNEPYRFHIYPKLSGQNYHLVLDGQEEMMVFDANRVSRILKRSDDFRSSL